MGECGAVFAGAEGVFVLAPSSLKKVLVRETARRGASLNDVAVGLLADYFAVP